MHYLKTCGHSIFTKRYKNTKKYFEIKFYSYYSIILVGIKFFPVNIATKIIINLKQFLQERSWLYLLLRSRLLYMTS